MKCRHLIIIIISLAGSVKIVFAQTVTLDYYFNHETHQDAQGHPTRFHYLWEDTTDTGFSILGNAFRKTGARLTSLETAPTPSNLKSTDIYIIVDPDNERESTHPNFIKPKNIDAIDHWVNAGGVLVIMANDSANVELPHFNHLANHFGMHFNNDVQNHVIDDQHFQEGAINISDSSIFKTANKIFIKDASSISLKAPAYAAVKNSNGAVIIAIAKYGKGTVFAVGDPWLYNEYTNGRLPANFENDKAANDLAQWLISQTKH